MNTRVRKLCSNRINGLRRILPSFTICLLAGVLCACGLRASVEGVADPTQSDPDSANASFLKQEARMNFDSQSSLFVFSSAHDPMRATSGSPVNTIYNGGEIVDVMAFTHPTERLLGFSPPNYGPQWNGTAHLQVPPASVLGLLPANTVAPITGLFRIRDFKNDFHGNWIGGATYAGRELNMGGPIWTDKTWIWRATNVNDPAESGSLTFPLDERSVRVDESDNFSGPPGRLRLWSDGVPTVDEQIILLNGGFNGFGMSGNARTVESQELLSFTVALGQFSGWGAPAISLAGGYNAIRNRGLPGEEKIGELFIGDQPLRPSGGAPLQIIFTSGEICNGRIEPTDPMGTSVFWMSVPNCNAFPEENVITLESLDPNAPFHLASSEMTVFDESAIAPRISVTYDVKDLE